MFQLLSGIARVPQLHDPSIPYFVKLGILKQEAKANGGIAELQISDTQGTTYTSNGTLKEGGKAWYQAALKGGQGIADPFQSSFDKFFLLILSVPIYDEASTIEETDKDVRGINQRG